MCRADGYPNLGRRYLQVHVLRVLDAPQALDGVTVNEEKDEIDLLLKEVWGASKSVHRQVWDASTTDICNDAPGTVTNIHKPCNVPLIHK